MEPIKAKNRGRGGGRGFTLIELLMVITLLLVFIGLAGAAIGSLATRFRVSDTGNRLAGMLELAHVYAATNQRIVIFRLYAPSGMAGTPTQFDTAALLELVRDADASDGTPVLREVPLGETFRFPPSVVVAGAFSDFHDTDYPVQAKAVPGETANRQAQDVRIHPDGTLSLMSDYVNPYLCVAGVHDLPPAGSPDNPFVLSVDPATGRVSTMQK